MDRQLTAAAVAATLLAASAGAASAQGACERLQALDNFGSVPFGARLLALPDGFSVVSSCDAGVSTAECVVRAPDGVTYSLYDGYVFSKFVEDEAAFPWGLEPGDDRSLAARRLRAASGQTARGILGQDGQAHLRSTFACGSQFGSIFARYRGDRIVSVGIETPL